jgi:hypothetical protein
MQDLLEHFDHQFQNYLLCDKALTESGVPKSGIEVPSENECFTSQRIRMLAADRDYWKAKANGNA